MPKVLLLPFLQIPSGHHQVADAVSRWLCSRREDINVEKIELLSHFNWIIEKMVSQIYLKWIDHLPGAYDWIYRYLSYHPSRSKDKHTGYELLFMQTMQRIINESQPDLILCTHALPSYLCSRLKVNGRISQPVVNIYTDFFINQVWGIDGIDLHFVPSVNVQQALIKQGVQESIIYVTGIPVDYVFHQSSRKRSEQYESLQVLIAGGSIGVGMDQQFFQRLIHEGQHNYTILCGKNGQLYEQILRLEAEHIHPLHYISSRSEMKQLYDQMDVIVTKPGGVTISEAIHTNLPIYIHSSLPGQEAINRDYLLQEQIALPIDLNRSIVEQLHKSIADSEQRSFLMHSMNNYRISLEWEQGLSSLIARL